MAVRADLGDLFSVRMAFSVNVFYAFSATPRPVENQAVREVVVQTEDDDKLFFVVSASFWVLFEHWVHREEDLQKAVQLF